MYFYSDRLNNFVFILLLINNDFKRTYSINNALVKTMDRNTISDSTKVVRMTTKILNNCYRDYLDNVVIVGDWGDFQGWHHHFPTELSYKMYGISQRKIYTQYQRTSGVYKLNDAIVKKLYYPARIFVISTQNHDFLCEVLVLLKKSIIWNSEAIFIIIEKSCNNSYDSNVKPAIKILWKFNILNTIYLCEGDEGNISFYNFNPYTAYAVKPWKLKDQILDESRNHKILIFHFTITVRNFKASLCGLLNFDKTSTIDNYPIRMSGTKSSPFKNDSILNISNYFKFEGTDAKIHKIIWEKLDANPTIEISERSYIDTDHKSHGSIKEVIEGKCDMGVNQYFIRNFWRLQTYPHWTSGIYAMSFKEKPNIDSRLMISEPVIYVIIILISLFIILSLKYYLKMNILQAFEGNFKLLLGISARYVGSGGKKLFLIYITFVAFVVNISLQSSLSSSLVLPKNIFSINNRDDLILAISLNYKTYGRPFVSEYLSESISKSFNFDTLSACVKNLPKRPKSVCLGDEFGIYYHANDVDDIYISKESIETWSCVYIVSEDWPLKPRVNFVIQKLTESGLIKYFVMNELAVSKTRISLQDTSEFRLLSLKSLDFSMYIWFVGLSAAFWIFLAEQMIMGHTGRIGANHHKLNNLNIFKQNCL